jgi:predicted TIM-barrel fold metal-dependent hydrolase
MAHQTPIRMEPSAYFYRQCLISADPDESVTAEMIRHLGADYFIWASDYPHIDASFGVVRELRAHLAALPEEARRKVLGDNAVRFYRLGAG